MAEFAVVVFEDSDEVDVVPDTWLVDGKCYWPRYRDTSKINRAVKEKVTPEKSWTQYDARVLSKCGKLTLIYIYIS